MQRFRVAALVAASLVVSGAAYAADPDQPDGKALTMSDGWYVSVDGGLSYLGTAANRSAGGFNFDSVSNNPGYDIDAALGKKLDNGFRVEGEVGYRRIDLDHINGLSGIDSGPARGNNDALSVMANGYYDIPTGGILTPYVGAGMGFAEVGMNDVSVGGSTIVNDDDLVLAYQAIGGLSYQLNPQGAIFAQYRYFATDDPTFTSTAGQRFKSEFDSNNFELGYRLSF